MTTPTSMLTSSARAWPVRRSVNVSAISWSRERSSPAATCAPAWAWRAAHTATPWATGRKPVTRAIASGAGRMLTRRSATAPRILRSGEVGSSW